MSHAAVFITCQMPVKSGRPSLVRAIPGPPGVCADTCVNASTEITTAIDGNVRALMNGLLPRAVYSHDDTTTAAAALHRELFPHQVCIDFILRFWNATIDGESEGTDDASDTVGDAQVCWALSKAS